MKSHQEQGDCWHQTHSQDRFPHLQTKLQHICYCLNTYNATTWFRLASTCYKFSRNIFWLKPINTWKMAGEWKAGVRLWCQAVSRKLNLNPELPAAMVCLHNIHPPKILTDLYILLGRRHHTNYCHPIQSAHRSLINSEHAEGTQSRITDNAPVCHQR